VASGIDNFEQMMRDNIRAVTAYARSIASHNDIAEEAVQETFIRAWRYSSSYRGDAPVLSWLITICRRVVVDLGQRHTCHAHDEIPDALQDPTDTYEMTALVDLVAALPLPQREVLVLCAILGFDYETAAETLSIPVGTVRSRLARARDALTSEMRQALAV
jgi:RNA polymerase sigma-70 factor (ECF subfamily)